MFSPENYPEESAEFAQFVIQTVTKVAVNAADLDLSSPVIAEIILRMSAEATQTAGRVANSGVVKIKTIPEFTEPLRPQASEVEKRGIFENYVDAISAKRRSVGYEADDLLPARIGIFEKPPVITHKIHTPKTTHEPEILEAIVVEVPDDDPTEDMLEAWAHLPPLSEQPETDLQSSKEALQKEWLSHPKNRNRAVRQLNAERDKSEEVAVGFGKRSSAPYSDIEIMDAIVRIDEATESVKMMYLSVDKDYDRVIKLKEVQDLADEFGDVRNLLRHMKRLAGDLPVPELTMPQVPQHTSLITSGPGVSYVWYNDQPLLPYEYEIARDWEDMNENLDDGLVLATTKAKAEA